MNSEDLAIGIDLGTTYSCVAVYQKDRVKIIANDEGNLTTSSCVAFTATERLIGDAAKSQVVLNPENTIFDSKRMIGRKFDDPKIQQDLENWQFKVVNKDGKPKIRNKVERETKTFTPEEISAMVLTEMKKTAESYLGTKVIEAVISVPACFNDSQRQATINAASIAGLNVIRIITEPTAAALAYRVNNKLKGVKTVLIFDLGGGTLDASVINIDDDWQFEVKTTAGDSHLGGEDFDNVLVAHFVEEFKTKHRRDLRTCPKAVRRLRIACEMAKKTLSSCHETWIDLGCLFKGIDFHSKLTRRQFEDMCMDMFRSTLKPVERVLSDAKMDKGSIDEVVLVGGSTRIPKIRELLKDFFDGKEPLMSINPDEAVAYGAAVQASVLNGRANKNLDFDNIYSVLLIDVTPLSLGIWTEGGVMSTVIKRNSRTPSRTSRIFSTDVDNQSNIDILVYEGEQAMAKDNHMLGRFRIGGIAPAPKRVPRIKVWFFLDLNGILSVNAESGQKLTVTNYKDGPSVEEIERMTDEARVCEKEDKVQRDRKLSWNNLESYVYSVKESVEYSPDDRFSFMDRKVVMKLCELFRGWMEENPLADTVDINLKLSEAIQRLNPYMVQVEKSKHPEPDLMEYGDLIIDESR